MPSVELVRMEYQTNIVKYGAYADISEEDYEALKNGDKTPREIASEYDCEFELDFDKPGNDEIEYSWNDN